MVNVDGHQPYFVDWPISFIPVLGKIFDEVMKEQQVTHFETNNLFAESQHGFRQGRSTVTSVTDLVSKIQTAFKEGELMGLNQSL